MTIAGTDHNPPQLGGFEFYNSQGFTRLTDLAVTAIEKYKHDLIISGMDLGWDTGLPLGAIRFSIPIIAAVPFEGQESSWRTLMLFEHIL